MLIGAILLVAQLCRFDGYPGCVAPRGKDKAFPVVAQPSKNFWARGLDFSCVSPWNSHGGRVRAGTAISKRHVIFAKHFPMSVGTRIVFVGEDGGICPCSITKTKAIPKTDIMIGALDYELTPNIKPAKVMRHDWMQSFAGVTNLPVVTFNQHEQLLYSELSVATNGVRAWNHAVEGTQRGKMPRLPVGGGDGVEVPEAAIQRKGRIIVGDSGDPAFMIYKGEPVLLYCLLSGGVGHGPWIHKHLYEIQSAMDELEPGYKLTFAE